MKEVPECHFWRMKSNYQLEIQFQPQVQFCHVPYKSCSAGNRILCTQCQSKFDTMCLSCFNNLFRNFSKSRDLDQPPVELHTKSLSGHLCHIQNCQRALVLQEWAFWKFLLKERLQLPDQGSPFWLSMGRKLALKFFHSCPCLSHSVTVSKTVVCCMQWWPRLSCYLISGCS